MLKTMKQKYGQHYASILKQSFGGAKEITCDWGVPIIKVTMEFENEGVTTLFIVSVDAETNNYFLNLQSYKLDGEVKVSENTNIDKQTIDFIVDTVVQITDNMFAEPVDEEKEKASNELQVDELPENFQESVEQKEKE